MPSRKSLIDAAHERERVNLAAVPESERTFVWYNDALAYFTKRMRVRPASKGRPSAVAPALSPSLVEINESLSKVAELARYAEPLTGSLIHPLFAHNLHWRGHGWLNSAVPASKRAENVDAFFECVSSTVPSTTTLGLMTFVEQRLSARDLRKQIGNILVDPELQTTAPLSDQVELRGLTDAIKWGTTDTPGLADAHWTINVATHNGQLLADRCWSDPNIAGVGLIVADFIVRHGTQPLSERGTSVIVDTLKAYESGDLRSAARMLVRGVTDRALSSSPETASTLDEMRGIARSSISTSFASGALPDQ